MTEATEPTVADVQAIYDQVIKGTNVPRFGKFYREQVGTLLAEIDRLSRRVAVLEADDNRLRAALKEYQLRAADNLVTVGEVDQGAGAAPTKSKKRGAGGKRGPRQRRVDEDYRGAPPP